MSNQKFDSRSGCLDYGNSYEFLMAAYYALKLSLNEAVSDFKMSTNNNDMGNFDDVVLEVKYSDGDEHLYALQLKHRGVKEDSITLQAFDAEKGGKFGLKKYCQGFKDTEKICRDNKSYTIPFEKFHFILYTNQVLPKFHAYDKNHQKVDSDEVQLKSKVTIYRHDECVARGLLDLSETDAFFIYKFRNGDKTQLDEEFLKQFLLYTKQKDAQEIECRISKFICNLFDNCDNTVITNYINFFKYWWRRDFGNLKLTKRDIMLKLSEYILTPHIPQVIFTTLSHRKKFDLLDQSFANFDLTVVEESESPDIDETIWTVILKDHFEGVDLSSWSHPSSDTNITFFANTNIPISAQGENFIEQSLKKVYVILWHMDKVPLFIKINPNSKKAIYAAIKLCENHEKKKKFVVLDQNFDDEEFSDEVTIFQKLSDLVSCSVYDEISHSVEVSLQGRENIRLDRLLDIDPDFHEIISVKEIIQMLNNSFVVGNDCKKDVSKHYVTRFCPKILLASGAIDEMVDDIFVVSLNGFVNFKPKSHTYALNKYLVLKENASASQFPNKFVILVDNVWNQDDFAKICLLNQDRNCHHVKVVSKNSIEWLETQGSVKCLKPHQLDFHHFDNNGFVEDSDMLEYFSNRINVLCAGPGMGKSILLKFLKYKCPPDRWVIFINLNDHIKFFREEHDFEEIVTYFLKHESEQRFVKDCIKIYAARRRILFLWDGFDELPVNSVQNVVSSVKKIAEEGFFQWIAARDNSKEFLENTFGLLAVTVTQFSEKNQKEYIYNHLTEKYDDDEKVQLMVSKLNKNMSSSLSCGYFDYSGVPLQIYMVMEIFLKNPEKYLEEVKIVTLTDIYTEFVDGKFRNLYERANASKNNYVMQKIQKKYKESQVLLYEVAALKASFDEATFSSLNLDCHDFLQKVEHDRDRLGLIFGFNDERKPIFTHKTFEEFLTASWLVKNYKAFPKLLQVILDHDQRNVRLMFDMILAKDSPIHIAVLYRHLDVLEGSTEDLSVCKDKGGRNPLHVACAWGTKHPRVNVYDKNIILTDEISNNPDENVEIVKFLLTRGCNPFETDKLYQWNVVEYCDRTLSLALLEVLVSSNCINLTDLPNFDIINLLYYSVQFNYPSVFYQLKIYPYIEILEGEDTRTLLQLAVKMDRTDFVATLLSQPQYQEVINKPFKDLGGPLFTAASHGNLQMFRLLQEKGAKLGQHQISPLIFAAAMGFTDFCQKLLSEDKMDPNQYNTDGNSVLQVAALRNHIDIMRLLLDHGADVNYVNYMDHTALDFCIDNKSLEGVCLLIEYKADLNRVSKTLYGYTPLHNACELNDEEIVKLLLQHGSDPTIKSNMLYTPLHVALINKQQNIAKILIEANPSVINEYSEEKSTAVTLAALNNYYDIIELLATLGADLDSKECKDSPLRIATLKGFDKSVEILIKYGADVNRRDNHGFTPLFYAIVNDNILKMFLDHSTTDVNAKSYSFVTALHFAAQNGKVHATEELLQHGAEVNAKDCKSETPLHYAIIAKDERVVKCLLKYSANLEDGISLIRLACIYDAPDCLLTLLNSGVDINVKDDQGRTALHFAATTSLYCVKLLVMKGINVNVCDNVVLSPLCYAVFLGKIDIIRELINSGDDITKGFGSSSPLHLSAGVGDVATLILLIKIGCNVNARDETGRTPLHCLVEKIPGPFVFEVIKFISSCKIKIDLERSYDNCAYELLDKDADVTLKNNFGWSPLVTAVLTNNVDMVTLFVKKFHHRGDLADEFKKCFLAAVSKNFLDILQFLIEENVTDVNTKEERTLMTALHYACVKDAYDCAACLVKNGADVNAMTVDGCTPLYFSASMGSFRIVRLLVEHQAEVDVRNFHGNSSLFAAAAQGFLDIVKFLHGCGADVNVVDDDGDVPLHDAAARGHVEVLQYLISNKGDVNCRNKSGKLPIDLARDNEQEEIVKVLQAF
ncbi:uncharacterized protein LOC135130478 [Zophobas morio]|uniref:uncharacterized protein LOC135130478 n=1 Tax=Zophobas morio TaxID=2755281 RepID=UPI003083243B